MPDAILDSIRIMVVDDDRVMREILRRMLAEGGMHDILAAPGGEDALALLTRETHAPDVILCDLHMRGLDGLGFCRKVRATEGASWRNVPIVILTAEQTPLVHEVARQVGASLVLTKPISTKSLLGVIGRMLGFTPAAPGAAPVPMRA